VRKYQKVAESFSLLGICILFALGNLVGCKPAPTTNTVVAQAQSPNGKWTAVLVDRFYKAALISDEFFLIVIPESQNPTEAMNARRIGNSSPFVATSANKVQLRWQDDATLLVICDSCGLEAIDIEKRLNNVGSIKIIYQGVPDQIP
jgi:hypothetical protein